MAKNGSSSSTGYSFDLEKGLLTKAGHTKAPFFVIMDESGYNGKDTVVAAYFTRRNQFKEKDLKEEKGAKKDLNEVYPESKRYKKMIEFVKEYGNFRYCAFEDDKTGADKTASKLKVFGSLICDVIIRENEGNFRNSFVIIDGAYPTEWFKRRLVERVNHSLSAYLIGKEVFSKFLTYMDSDTLSDPNKSFIYMTAAKTLESFFLNDEAIKRTKPLVRELAQEHIIFLSNADKTYEKSVIIDRLAYYLKILTKKREIKQDKFFQDRLCELNKEMFVPDKKFMHWMLEWINSQQN